MVSAGKTVSTRSLELEPLMEGGAGGGLREKRRSYGGELGLEAVGQGGAQAIGGDYAQGGDAGCALPRILGAAGRTGPASPVVLRY